MIKVEHIETWGFEHAVRGMRNPMNSWENSDSFEQQYWDNEKSMNLLEYHIGEKDLDLMHGLCTAGTEHRKYLRQIFVSMDITAPLYWWKEFDTYKVGTVANSCSTMHKIASRNLTLNDFSYEHLHDISLGVLQNTIDHINRMMNAYRANLRKCDWWQIIQLLPSSYNQKRTVTMNYENVISIIDQRTGHKLDEWRDFVKCLFQLPHVKKIRC